MRLTRAQAPWLFAKETFRSIASLELLASLIGIMLLIKPGQFERAKDALISFGASTDNKGNAHLVDKHLTTKFPLALILLELSTQLHDRNLTLTLNWLERGANQFADDLTNEVFGDFDESLRVKADWDELPFTHLRFLLDETMRFQKLLEEVKQKRREEVNPEGSRKAPRRQKLREREPW